jgi:DNA (cytosine-5)-methyltransferase 1
VTHGFGQAGISVVAGVDIDPACRFPIEANNPGTHFLEKNVADLNSDELSSYYPKESVRILVGCAPCQPFSKYAVRQGQDRRWELLYDFLRLVFDTKPDVSGVLKLPFDRRPEVVG